MCTVTFIPSNGSNYLTSNRDEHFSRKIALYPQKYSEGNYNIVYPQDRDGGGSWIAMKSNGDAAVLLNGAFQKHERLPSYRKSRGLIFIEIIKAVSPGIYFQKMDLNKIEPFTIIIFINNELFECRWDGSKKHLLRLDHTVSHIWSSVTLYNEATRNSRKNWFNDWQRSIENINKEKILNFHQFGGIEDPENGLVINREGKMRTVSITSIKLSGSDASMTYLDLLNKNQFVENLSFKSKPKRRTAAKNLVLSAKKFFIRISNREYWPHNVVYAPLYFYWLWLSLKARSFFFFNASNPLIKNGGFLMESKKEIYDLIPSELYPETLLCQAGLSMNDLKVQINKKRFQFPVIAKPDIGMLGLKVELLNSEEDVASYLAKTKVDFLLQEFIDYDNEAGIFYYRLPGDENGKISGIVGKEFVTIVGDGKSTIEELLLKNDRYILQLKELHSAYAESFHSILPEATKKVLAPYGNHSRGAKFTDLTNMADQKLTTTIDAICKRIPEFYYGRLDIKFNSWEDLCNGKNFSIIELNGAGSEPTHIYDPSHSLFFVWKEVIRHWHLLLKISRLNAKQKRIKYMTTSEGLKMFRDNNQYLKLLS